MDRVDLSIPFHVARAYGVAANTGVQPVRAEPRVLDADTSPLAFVAPKSKVPAAAKLSAGVVPGRVDFKAGEAVVDAALQMYRHPADKNVVATLLAGRRVDVTG